jgi:cation/acetate symporter
MPINLVAAGVFLAFVLTTLGITLWASRRTRTAGQFYAAEGRITPGQNALAIAGDYLSAASFLGSIAAFWALGVDGLVYMVGAAAGWPIVMCLTAERLRNLGRYTFSDVLCHRLEQRPVRLLTATTTLVICGTYLVSQMVGAGKLVETLFHLPYEWAVGLVGALMIVYVMLGGMVATTWIQIVKATVLLGASAAMVVIVLERSGFDLATLAADAAATRGSAEALLAPTGLLKDPISAIGLALAFAFGPAGMPHILMRFFTVKDGVAARRSLALASILIVTFQAMMIVLGYAAIAYVTGDARYYGSDGALTGGGNMAAVHLAHDLGGSALYGVIAATAFATILAVVAGLTLAAASAVSHELYNNVLRRGEADERTEIRVSRAACVAIGAIAVGLGLLFQHESIAFLATLPLVIAASVNFPLLLLVMYWRGLTTTGAIAGGVVGLASSVTLVVVSPKVWVDALGHDSTWFPYDYPTLLSLPAAFLVAWWVSRFGPRERGRAQ